MSNLLEQASLVLIPSGYAEDIVYSEIPLDGSGDMVFTRASNGTRVNFDGLVEVVPWNLVQESETFDNAGWVKQSSTITANSTTAPNGTLTADTVNATTAQYSGIYQSLGTLPTNVYTYSIYAKAGTNSFVYMLGQGSPSQIAIFNLSTGVVTSTSNLDSASIESVGDGWYRCQIQKTGAGVEMFVGFSNIANTTPTASGTVFIWGAQFNIGSTAKPYFPTTDRLNVPRLTYQYGGGGCPSLLLEKQSTNTITYSEDITNSLTSQANTTVTANDGTSPDGTQNADLIGFTGSNAYRLRNQTVAATTTYTMSLFVKNNNFASSEMLYFNMSDGVVGGLTANINVFAKTATFSGAGGAYTGVSGKVEDYGNGWFRVSITGTSVSGGAGWYEIATAGITRSCYVWGLSLEISSYPTSYINTTSASATRVADSCSKTGISSLIGQSEGTLFFDGYCNSNAEIISINRSTVNSVFLYSAIGNVRAYVYSDSTGLNLPSSVSCLTRFKAAVAYKSNSIAFYVNGTLISQDTSTTFTPNITMENFYIAQGGYVEAKEQVNCNEAIIFPTRLTNSELASLTTL